MYLNFDAKYVFHQLKYLNICTKNQIENSWI